MLSIDLHSHSSVSDGLLTPADVVHRAAKNGATLLALTDHDELSGLDEASATASAYPTMRFVNGVEISTEWEGSQIHIVGLGFNLGDRVLNDALQGIREGRMKRAHRMAKALSDVGIDGTFEGASRYAKNPALIGRAHFARFLVESGVSKDVKSVFDHYLVPGKPGYVNHVWNTVAEAVEWISGAGGVAVLAHPGRYRLSKKELHALVDVFQCSGGAAIEVVSGSHTPEHVLLSARLAKEFKLMASCGSDFHGPGESMVDVGLLVDLPDGLSPVWECL